MQYFLSLVFAITFFSGNIIAQDWSLVWQDEFSGNTLDDSKWMQEMGTGSQYGLWGWGNSELQYYQPENSVVSDGTLKIIVKEESVAGMDYTSSRIKTDGNFAFRYGKVQAKMKTVDGQGFWPAFWMLPSGGSWPCDGEIDIMEQWANNGFTNQTTGAAHVGVCPGVSTYNSFYHNIPIGSYADDFHIYEVQWFEDYIAWFVDDEKVHEISPQTFPNNEWPFNDNDWYIILNFAISSSGTNENTAFPSQVEVDWVRVFEENGDSGCTDSIAYNFNPNSTIDIGNCQYEINFELNLNCEDFTPTSVNVTGPNDNWSCSNGTSLIDPDGDGFWTGIAYLPLGDFEYIFCADGWTQSEDLLSYATATADWSCSPITDYISYANRSHTVQGATTISQVWSSCAECNELPDYLGCTDAVAVNFNSNSLTDDGTCEYIVDQLQITVDVCSSASQVRITGPWWSWNPNTGPIAENNGDGTWTFTFDPVPTEDMEFLIVVDGIQENMIQENTDADDWSCTPITDYYSYANRIWMEGSGDMSLVYGTCNSYCEGQDDSMAFVEFFVDMNGVDQPSTEYDNVVVNGSWNNWNGWGLLLSDENEDGIYSGTLEVEPSIDFHYVVAVTGFADAFSGWGMQWGDGCLGYNGVVSVGTAGSLTNTYLSAGCASVEIIGCTDVNAENYNVSANQDEIDQNGNSICIYSSCDNAPENGCLYSGGFGFF
jgi:beta-glucanase (GH16 family)